MEALHPRPVGRRSCSPLDPGALTAAAPVNTPPLSLAPDRDPWDRQPDETARRYSQFRAYLDLGRTRTLAESSRTLALSAAYVRNLAAAHRWRDRAAAYDRHGDLLADAAWLEERRQAARDDARTLAKAAAIVEAALDAIDPTDIRVPDLIRLLDVVMRHRRALLGNATQATTVVVTSQAAVDRDEFSRLPPEQQRVRIADLAASVLRRTRALAGEDDDEDDQVVTRIA